MAANTFTVDANSGNPQITTGGGRSYEWTLEGNGTMADTSDQFADGDVCRLRIIQGGPMGLHTFNYDGHVHFIGSAPSLSLVMGSWVELLLTYIDGQWWELSREVNAL